MNDYQQKEFEEQAYRFLKFKSDEDPESLSEIEGALYLLLSSARDLKNQERIEQYREFYRKVYAGAQALLNSYEAGSYTGDDFPGDFRRLMPAETDYFVRLLEDIDLLVEINDLEERFMEINLKLNPLPEEIPVTPEQRQAIDEERQALVEAGYPQDEIEKEARRRGTFKHAFGADRLPPIKGK